MKVSLLSLFLFTTSVFSVYSQKSIVHELPDRLFYRGKEMFSDKNFIGAQHTLTEYKRTGKDKNLIAEADYMIAVSDYFRGRENSIEALRDYPDKYPETPHRNDIAFYIGSYYFGEKDWDRALSWFNNSDVDYLSLSDQEDYTFRSAYTDLQKGNSGKAAGKFGLLAKNSDKYFHAATYYGAYIDFQEGNYDRALNVFERLKSNPEYAEQSYFFIAQGLFLKNDLNKTVEAGQSYLSKYPGSRNSAEVYRILGNSYYRMDNIEQSVANYEKYLSSEDRPFREDMLLLGTAYSRTNKPAQAIKALQIAASKDDGPGQTAYMLLGQNYLKTGDGNNALMAFDAASRVSFDPSVSEAALYNYAMLVHQTSLSVFDQSITVLQRFLNEYPNSKYTDEINNQLASTLLSTNNYRAALNVIDQMRSPGRQITEAKQTILFQLGAQAFIDGDYNRAIQDFNACIGMGNYDTKSKNEAYFWRGETYYRMNDYRSAARDYQTYISSVDASAENYTGALYNSGYTYFNLKQYNDALNRFGQYTKQERNKQGLTYSDALNRMGDCYLYNRNFAEAEKMYSQASRSSNQSAEYADFQRAFVMGLQHNYNGKVSALDAMMRKYPSSQYYDDALFEKSRALIMLGKENESIQVLNQLLRDYPGSNIAAQAGVQLGQAYYNTDNTQQAIEAYKSVARSYKNTEEARMAVQSLEGIYRDINDISSYASFVNSLGGGMAVSSSRQDSLTYLAAESVYLKGRTAEATAAMTNYLRSYPSGSFAGDAHYYIGSVAYDNKDYDKALAEFTAAINSGTSKNLNKAFALTGQMHLERGNAQAAYNAYKQWGRLATSAEDRTAAQWGIIKAANALNNDSEVIQAASQLLSDEKTSPEVQNEALLYRAKAYLKTGNTNGATADLQKAATDTRSVYGAEAHCLLAENYFKAGLYDKAEQQVISFMKQNTPHAYWMARAIIVLADTYKAQGDKFQAKQYLESLRENYTGNEADIKAMITSRLEALK